MLDSYFFVPGDNRKFIAKIKELDADYFVLDLEDSVSSNNKQSAIQEVLKLNIDESTFVRVSFKKKDFSNIQLSQLINHFEGRVVLPKIDTISDIQEVVELNHPSNPLRAILLVESPTCFINLKEILNAFGSHIIAVGFGSHDFCASMAMKHSLETLAQYKKELLLISKAFNKDYIDTVDLDLNDFTVFEDECIFAFNNGAEGKFLIHPKQIRRMKDLSYLTDREIERMKYVFSKISKIDSNDVDVLKIDGEIYEKPHIQRINKLLNRLNRES